MLDIAKIKEEEEFVVAGQWTLIWRKFRKHRLAMFSGVVIIFIYIVVLTPEFFAPFTPDEYGASYTYAPPQPLHLFDQTEDGLRFSPIVNGYKVEIDYDAGRRNFVVDPEAKHPVGFFVHGAPYKLLRDY